MEIRPIAVIKTDFKEKFGIPRQSGLVPSSRARIIFEPEFRSPEAIRGIDGFSHIWLLFDFSESHREGWSPTVRPPRLGGNVRMGVFATRSPFRPNSIGMSSVRLISVEDSDEGPVLIVEGADLLDGTPIYDIKPYIRYTDSHEDAVSGFADDVFGQRLNVHDDDRILSELDEMHRRELFEALAQDPRPSYQNDSREYSMRFADYDVSFRIEGTELRITGMKRCIRSQ